MTSDRDLLDEQVAYYRARAAEYDATSSPEGDPFAAQAESIRAALRRFDPRGRVLEVAAGTGQWTSQLAQTADELVVTDSAPEMLALNRQKTGAIAHVRYVVADAFALERDVGTTPFDAVHIGFFLSHVPLTRFATFWDGIGRLLAPGGRVFFVDEGRHDLWREDWIERRAGIVRRTLRSGATHRAVKVLWAAGELENRLRDLGWEASVQDASPFYWGTARRPDLDARVDVPAE